jgi:hypothetical protein
MLKKVYFLHFACGLIFILLAVLFLSEPGFCATASLKFSARLEKTEYSLDEPINVTFYLKNLGQKPVLINARFYISSQEAKKNQRDVYLILTSPSGAKLACKYFYETGLPKTEYFKLLAAGEEIKSEYPRNLKGFFEIVEPGPYKLTAVYQNVFGAEIGLDTFTGQLISEPVKFTIVSSKNQGKDVSNKK